MSDIKKFLQIMNESTAGASVSGGVAPVAQEFAPTQRRTEETSKAEDSAPKILEYGMWENSALATTSKLKKNRGKSSKVVKSIYGEDESTEQDKKVEENTGIKKKMNESALLEGLDPVKRARLDDLIDQFRDATDPSDYYDREYSDPDDVIDTIRAEFGDNIADKVSAGEAKMHFPRDGHTDWKADPMGWKKPVDRITKAGKMFKQDSDFRKNTLKARLRNRGKVTEQGVAEGKFTRNSKTGAKLDPRTGAELPPKEKPLTMKDMFRQPKSTAPKLTLDAVWRKVEDVVGQIFPDGDPIDYLAPWLEKHGIRDFKIGEILDRAAKKNGYKDLYDYYDSMKDQYARDNVAEGYSLKKTNVEKYMKPGDPDEYTQDINIKDTDYEIINNKTGQLVGSASWTTNDFFGPGALKITMKNGATRWLDIWEREKGNPQTAFNRFVKDPKTAKKYKEQGVAEADQYVGRMTNPQVGQSVIVDTSSYDESYGLNPQEKGVIDRVLPSGKTIHVKLKSTGQTLIFGPEDIKMQGVAEGSNINVQNGEVYNRKGRLMGTWDGRKFDMDPAAEAHLDDEVGPEGVAHWKNVYQSQLTKQTAPPQRTSMTHRYVDDLAYQQAQKGVAEGLDPDTQRLEQEVRDALANGDDYTAKSLIKMAQTAADRNYLRKIIRQEMYGNGPVQDGVAEGFNSKLKEQDLILNPASLSRNIQGLMPRGIDRTDHEVEMAKSDLYQAGKNASAIFKMIKDLSEDQGLEGWVQEKITKAADYLNIVQEYLEGKQFSEQKMFWDADRPAEPWNTIDRIAGGAKMQESMDGVSPSTKMFAEKQQHTEGKCSKCGGASYDDEMIAEEKDACYSKVKSRYKVWPSAYASGALVKCRKVGAKNWGSSKK